jgi:hypothetical protein
MTLALVATFTVSAIVPTAFAQGAATFAPVVSQAKQDFELHNETGLEITEVYLSETGSDSWEEDVLGQDTLAPDDSVNITFGGQKANLWDMKVVFSGGKSEYWRKVNLSELTDITISFKNGKPYATWKNGG